MQRFNIVTKPNSYRVQSFDGNISEWKHKTDLEYGQIWENIHNLSIAEAYPLNDSNHL